MEIFFRTASNGENEEEKKSVFVKIPLTGEAGKNFKQVLFEKLNAQLSLKNICYYICLCYILQFYFEFMRTIDKFHIEVNVREFEMFTNILPQLQTHLDENCEGKFQMK